MKNHKIPTKIRVVYEHLFHIYEEFYSILLGVPTFFKKQNEILAFDITQLTSSCKEI